MKLRRAIHNYIAWQRAHGAKFESGAFMLLHFCRGIDGEISCGAVTREQVLAYLQGKEGRLTRYRAVKYSTLSVFYRYAISRGYASSSPLPLNEPKPPASAPPYIYSQDEIHRLLGAVDICRSRARQLDAHTLRTLLLILYGAGLRVGEARRLSLEDVDLSAAVMHVRQTKFYKSRLVPVGPRLAAELRNYAKLRGTRPLPFGRHSSFLANRDGTSLDKSTLNYAFAMLLRYVGINNKDGTRQSPRLHSLRHTFAVHRLTGWYREGADVQRLLPVLSTYLGHKNPAGTQVYLSMTPELLQQASLRFESYTQGGSDD